MDKEIISLNNETPKDESLKIPNQLEQKSDLKFDSKKPQLKIKTENPEPFNKKGNVKVEKTDQSKSTSHNLLNTASKYLVTEQTKNDDEKDQENQEKREFPLWIFIVLISLLILIGSVVIGLLWMFAYTSLIYGAFSGGIFLNILAGLIVSIPTVAIYYSIFYLFFYLFYGNDPYYSKKEEFKSDFWKISSIFLGILTGLILVIIFVGLANIW